ncbi:hypothetical protein MMC24_003732 [Lignoscripta atroalba]|nr:hypothetical protein [Lignoscripta atroalba]
MSISHVCFRCRIGAEARLFSRSFISLTKPPEHSDLLAAASEVKENTKGRDVKDEASLPLKPFSRQRQRQRQHESPSPNVNKLLESLFTSTQRQKPYGPVKTRYSNKLTVTATPTDAEIVQRALKADIESLERSFYKHNVLTQEVWQVFEELCSSKIWILSPTKSLLERSVLQESKVFRDILLAAVQNRSETTERVLLPTPAQIIRVYLKGGLMREWWNPVLWSLLGRFVELSLLSTTKEPQEILRRDLETNLQQSFTVMQDILDVWRVYIERFGLLPHRSSQTSHSQVAASRNRDPPNIDLAKPNPVFDTTYVWIGLPSVTDLASLDQAIPTDFKDRFLQFLPRKQETHGDRSTAIAAAVSLLCLQARGSDLSSRGLQGVEQFSNFVGHLIRGSKLDAANLRLCFMQEGLHSRIVNQLLTWWDDLRPKARAVVYDNEKYVPVPHRKKPLEGKLEQKSERSNLSKDLHKAVHQSDLRLVQKLWRNFETRLEESSGDGFEISRNFAEFLRAFNALGRSERAIDVWNIMVRSGCKPVQHHWLAMLEGCRKARDLSSLHSIWRRMKATGIEPDNQIWTTYISGLLQSRDWQTCLQVLEEMGEAWKSATTAKSNSSFQIAQTTTVPDNTPYLPSIIPVNAAMSGLIGMNKGEVALTVLRWATARGLRPDTSTFNILLRVAVREGRSQDVQWILHEMEQVGCSPDVVTFTILLDGLFRNSKSSFQSQSAEEQEAAVSRIFCEIEGSGIKANAHTYGTLLDGLLAGRSINIMAARAVLNHMTRHNIKPSPHIYTILVTHYFSSTPPNLPAIDGLLHRIKIEKSSVDHVFYDRMIEGYGGVGEIEKMLTILRRMPSEGKAPGWIALLCVLRALVQTQEWDLVRDLVRDLVDEDGLFRHGSRGWRGRDEFWSLVADLRARGIDIPTPSPAARA